MENILSVEDSYSPGLRAHSGSRIMCMVLVEEGEQSRIWFSEEICFESHSGDFPYTPSGLFVRISNRTLREEMGNRRQRLVVASLVSSLACVLRVI